MTEIFEKFENEFGEAVVDVLVHNWNLYFCGLEIVPLLKLQKFLKNFLENTEVKFSEEKRGVVDVIRGKCIVFNVQTFFIHNFCDVFERSVERFFAKGNYEFMDDGKVVNFLVVDLGKCLDLLTEVLQRYSGMSMEEEKRMLVFVYTV